MGMFDWVTGVPDMRCVQCDEPLSGWQTKDTACTCDEVPYFAARNFYTDCRKCWAWHEFVERPRVPPERPLSDYKLIVTESNAHDSLKPKLDRKPIPEENTP